MALKGRKWADMEKHMYRVMKVALPTTVIILCVGMMIAASIAAGTVQTVLVYGLGILKPTVFLPRHLYFDDDCLARYRNILGYGRYGRPCHGRHW